MDFVYKIVIAFLMHSIRRNYNVCRYTDAVGRHHVAVLTCHKCVRCPVSVPDRAMLLFVSLLKAGLCAEIHRDGDGLFIILLHQCTSTSLHTC